MRRPYPRLKTLIHASLLLTVGLRPGFAWEADAVADRYRALLNNQGIEATWSGLNTQGDTLILQDHTVSMAGTDETIMLGDIALSAVSETDNGYLIGNITLDTLEQERDSVRVTLSGLAINDLVLPKEDGGDPYGGIMRYGGLTLERLTIGSEAMPELFSLAGVSAKTTKSDNDGTLSFSGQASRFQADLVAIQKMAETGKNVNLLGYEQIAGQIEMEGSWQPQDGRVRLSRYHVAVDDAGALTLSADISGYTPDFIKAARDMSSNAAKGGDSQAQSLAILGLAQQLSLHGAAIRFTDASLTGRVLDYAASQQGAKASDIANQTKAIIPLMAGQYLEPEMTQSLSRAVSSFLDDPQNIEIRVAPAEPTPFPVLMGAAMSSPAALIKQLGLNITANQ